MYRDVGANESEVALYISTALDQATTVFEGFGCDIGEYVYEALYNSRRGVLQIFLLICCGDGNQFDDEYIFPDGYELYDDGAAFHMIDIDDDDESDPLLFGFATKEIIVFCILS